MTEPLDFSSIGSKTGAPPAKAPRKPPKKPPGAPKQPRAKQPKAPRSLPIGGAGLDRRTMVLAVTAAVILAGLAYMVFGGGGESPAHKALTTARYCTLASAFEQAAPLPGPVSSPPLPPASVIKGVLTAMGGTVNEMKAVAPGAIRSDVAANVAAVQKAADGNLADVRSAAFKARQRHIATFRHLQCGGTPETPGG